MEKYKAAVVPILRSESGGSNCGRVLRAYISGKDVKPEHCASFLLSSGLDMDTLRL